VLEIFKADRLAEEGILVLEHGAREEMPETIGEAKKWKERRYGKVVLSFLCVLN